MNISTLSAIQNQMDSLDMMVLPSWGVIFLGLIAFFTGASLASFVNVLIYRVPLDMSVTYPPSACPHCRHSIRWFENIPIVSFLLLRGRCRACRSIISIRYPIIELMGGVWGLMLAMRWVWPTIQQVHLWIEDVSVLYPLLGAWGLDLLFISALIAIAFIDLEYTFIPDEITLPATLIGIWGSFTLATWLPQYEPIDHLLGAGIGWLVIILIRALAYLYYQREAMGLGDAKLLMLIGAYLGWRALPMVLLLGSVQGVMAAIVALTYTYMTGDQNQLTMTTSELDERFGEESLDEGNQLAIPFGPFLVLATLEIIVLGDDLLEWWL